ncbi:MAG: L-asparaginase, partial [Lachnospiraceae bacterium]|nr:L-asparaginase [Lachnospiraceae bacterium]
TITSTYNVTAISSSGMCAIGIVRDGAVYLYTSPSKCHTTESIFDVRKIDKLPKVSILYFHADADPGFLEYAAKFSDGIVIAGAGAGEFSKSYKSIIEKLNIPVVVCSRIDGGIIFKENLLCDNTVAADNLSPQKAAVLLRLALACKINRQNLQEIFMKY